MRYWFWLVGCIGCLFFTQSSAEAHHDSTRVIQAIRINPHRPVLDGVLDDAIWQKAPKSSGFRQRQPDEGEWATERTTVQVCYDDEAIYFGFMCYDSSPDSIVAPLARRDRWIETDRVIVNIDPYHDHRTGMYFAVGPSGWMGDGIMFKDTWEDDTWDGVWEARASQVDSGWSAEFRIPYRVLRFSEKDDYSWGVNFSRTISRKRERVRWQWKSSNEPGWVSRFGHLEGISGIRPKRALEVIPYVVGQGGFKPQSDAVPTGREASATMGVDVRYGLTSNISLNATVNPDFGQVEADPSVLNLGVFETFLAERRPFFLEGNSLFESTGPGIVGIDEPAKLFHSRRIGKRPGRFDAPDNSDVIDQPDGTTILGALKLSGKTERGMSFGFVEAVTDDEFALIKEAVPGQVDSVQSLYRIEPVTNFFVGRLQQDLSDGSVVGGTFTAMNGKDIEPSYVGSVDGEVKWHDNAYRIFSRFAASRRTDDGVREGGYEYALYFSKFSGKFGGQAYFDARSPNFNVNDLGFMNRSDRIQAGWHVFYQIREPWVLAEESGFNVNGWQHWNYDGEIIRRGLNFNMWHDLANNWWWNMGFNREFEVMDDLITRGGPLMKKPAGIEYWFGIGSDRRKPVEVRLFGNGDRLDGGVLLNQSYSLDVRLRPASNFTLDIRPRYRRTSNFAQWVENLDTNGDDDDDVFVFGNLKSSVWDVTTRVTWSFTPEMSLQAFVQQFVTAGDYRDLKELAQPRTYSFVPFTGVLDEDPDFDRRSLKSNLVFRWEYRPGSTVFLVWSQSRRTSFDDPNPQFRPWSGMWDALGDEGDNVFLVKLNYWLGI